MVVFQFLSTLSNFCFSKGSFFLISSEAKMGCKYIQFRWHLIQPSKVSCINYSRPSHWLHCFWTGTINALCFIIPIIFKKSSIVYWSSSIPLKQYVPLYSNKSSFNSFNFSIISSNFFSIPHFLSHFLLNSSILALCSNIPYSFNFLKVISSFAASIFKLQSRNISFQYAGFLIIASVVNNSITHIICLNSLMSVFNSYAILFASYSSDSSNIFINFEQSI